MKKRFFDRHLYVDGLKQLKLMGILFTVLFSLVGVVTPIMNYLESLNWATIRASKVDGLTMNPLLVLLFCAVTPLMALYLFSFLNKRESSDFYHAIPHTRQCLFFSFFAAVMTWTVMIAILSTVLAVTAYSAFPALYLINYGSVLYLLLNCLAGSLLVAGAVTIAMSVTGTIFTNLLVALLLIFFPRIFLQLATTCVQSAFPLISNVNFAPILNYSYNVPVGFVFSAFNGNSEEVLTSLSGGIYTTVIGLLYTGIAAFLFVVRRSEGAGHSAPSKRLQGLFRFLVGFAVSFVATLGLFNVLKNSSHYTTSDIAQMVLVYLAALLLTAVFEVLCTRRFRGLVKKCLFTALLLIVANTALLGGMFSLYHSLSSFSPDTEEIQSVRIWNDNQSTDYISSRTSKIQLTDPAIKSIIADGLKDSLELAKISSERYYEQGNRAHFLTVAIDSGWFTRYRRIVITNEHMVQLLEKLQTSDEYRSVYDTLPKTVSSIEVYGEVGSLYFKTKEDAETAYAIFKKEFETLDFETRYALFNQSHYYENVFALLELQLAEDGKWYSFSMVADPTLFPETINYIIQKANEDAQSQQSLKTLMEDFDQIDSLSLNVYYPPGSGSDYYYIPFVHAEDILPDIQEWLCALAQRDTLFSANTDGVFYRVNAYIERWETSHGETYSYTEHYAFFVNETGDDLPDWLSDKYKP